MAKKLEVEELERQGLDTETASMLAALHNQYGIGPETLRETGLFGSPDVHGADPLDALLVVLHHGADPERTLESLQNTKVRENFIWRAEHFFGGDMDWIFADVLDGNLDVAALALAPPEMGRGALRDIFGPEIKDINAYAACLFGREA